MTKDRMTDQDKLATGAIDEYLEYRQSGNPALEFWKGVKMVIDELQRDADKQSVSSIGQVSCI